jgi:predicted alpha/beta-hydrolase family hydrolase
MAAAREVSIATPRGPIAGLHRSVRGARWLYVFGHGAGAGMRHPFMAAVAEALAARRIATLRWEQPAMTAGKGRCDPPAVVEVLARAACAHGAALAGRAKLPLRVCAGGKSMGGRMTSQAQAAAAMPGLEALVFLGFPLHPAGEPAVTRAAHLASVALPMLFVQGTRDALATPALLRPVLAALPAARLVELDGADHGLDVAKRAGYDPIARAADAVEQFLLGLP